jgi:hypothetical protein
VDEDTPARGHSSKITLTHLPPYLNGTNKSKWETVVDALGNYLWVCKSELALKRRS